MTRQRGVRVATPNRARQTENTEPYADGRRTPQPIDPFDLADAESRRFRPLEPTRISAGICPSCGGQIDALTAECRCSQ